MTSEENKSGEERIKAAWERYNTAVHDYANLNGLIFWMTEWVKYPGKLVPHKLKPERKGERQMLEWAKKMHERWKLRNEEHTAAINNLLETLFQELDKVLPPEEPPKEPPPATPS